MTQSATKDTQDLRHALGPYREAFDSRADARTAEAAFLRELRTAAFQHLESTGFPTRKDEDWRFTDLTSLIKTEFAPAAPSRNGLKGGDLAAHVYPGTHRLVFVNGRLSDDLSDVDGLPDGIWIGTLDQATDAHPATVEAHLGRLAEYEGHPFVALNTALFDDALVLIANPEVRLETPIHVVFVSTGDKTLVTPRVLMVAGDGAEVTMVETHIGHGHSYFSCGVTEVALGQNAVVDHYKLQAEDTSAYHLHTLKVITDRDAHFASHSISTGGGLVRHDVRALLKGEGGHCTLNGLYMVRGEQFVDTHMFVEHKAPHCTSHELYKGILDERSRGVFNGRIFVHQSAQQTDAIQSNRNLLLSREALVNSNPQLEIFADDVRCTHGSTTGQLDPDAIFYLRSRGMSEKSARSLLVYAFASDIVDRIKVPPVRQDLEEFLFSRLPRGDVVRQAV